MSETAAEIQALRQEIEVLRGELSSLRQSLSSGAPPSGSPHGSEPLHFRVASLEIVGEPTPRQTPRFKVVLSIEEHGGALQFLDAQAGSSGKQAGLVVTDEGVALALCGSNGVPRAVLTGREAGGSASFIDAQGQLAAEICGSEEAAWLMLNHEGTPRTVSVATAAGGNLELFDENATVSVVLPPGSEGAYSPE